MADRSNDASRSQAAASEEQNCADRPESGHSSDAPASERDVVERAEAWAAEWPGPIPAPPGSVLEALDLIRTVIAECKRGRRTIARLNRRCQSAEMGLQQKLHDQGETRAFGRSLANAAARMYREKLQEAEAELVLLRAKVASETAG